MVATRVIMVELMTRNKALPGYSPDYHLFIYLFISLSIKARACSRIQFSFGYLWSLTIPGGNQRERWIGNTYEHESYTDYNTSICIDEGTTAEGDLNSIHLKFCKLQVWGYVTIHILFWNWCMSSHLVL